MANNTKITIEEMATFAKSRGFIFPNSEIYGGYTGFFDFGPLGVELKNNIKQLWWKRFVHERDDVVGIDGSIISHPSVWKASGHVDSFEDILIECRKCNGRFRADHLVEIELNITAAGLSAKDLDLMIKENEIKCPTCDTFEWDKANQFNLMFSTNVGPRVTDTSKAYLRPETAQLIFTNFKQVTDIGRVKLPFGIAQIGKAFRNEISPRDFLFRCREFEQMEIEFFVHPEKKECPFIQDILEFEFNLLSEKDQDENKDHKKITVHDMIKTQLLEPWHAYWLSETYRWFLELGISKENIRLRQHKKDELAHYSKACFDIEYNFPFGWKEIHGNANRGCFDLQEHSRASGKSLELFDEETKQKVLPQVIEPSQGVERAFLAFLFESYDDDKERGNIVLHLNPKLAPMQIGVFPLVNKLEDKTLEIYSKIKKEFHCFYDRSGSVGRRYARADERGVPCCITVDFETLVDGCVTVRDRDTTLQERVKMENLKDYLSKALKKTE